MWELVEDLKDMGEGNAILGRSVFNLLLFVDPHEPKNCQSGDIFCIGTLWPQLLPSIKVMSTCPLKSRMYLHSFTYRATR